MSQPLSASTLSRLPSVVLRSRYDRSAVKSSIVHIGVGGFFRAHQAVYADELLENGGDPRWGYCGVGLLPQDRRMYDVLRSQDHLYTVVARSKGQSQARIVRSLVDYLFAPDNSESVFEKIAAPETEIVSLTITEGGYYINGATGGFDVEHPDIKHDLENPSSPRCTFGYLAAALERRRLQGGTPITLMSCDNIQGNGDLFKRHFTAFAELYSAPLARWLEKNCTFPNTMVDRITPATTDKDRAWVKETYQIDDGWPVVTETFRQWVVEDHFALGRPRWETCGVQITTDVASYEKIKLRVLNGSHQALCYIGMLLGYTYVHEALNDPGVLALVRQFMVREVAPVLSAAPGMDLAVYQDQVVERFLNEAIADRLSRISIYGSSGIPQFLLPTIQDQIQRGGPIELASFVIASWLRALDGCDDQGRELALLDPKRSSLAPIAKAARLDPKTFSFPPELFGRLATEARFCDCVRTSLADFNRLGARNALARCIESIPATGNAKP